MTPTLTTPNQFRGSIFELEVELLIFPFAELQQLLTGVVTQIVCACVCSPGPERCLVCIRVAASRRLLRWSESDGISILLAPTLPQSQQGSFSGPLSLGGPGSRPGQSEGPLLSARAGRTCVQP